MGEEIINKECFNCVNNAGWSLKELNYTLKDSIFYKKYLCQLSYTDIFVKAFIYAKKDEYVDMIMQRMIHKNDKEFAFDIFRRGFKNLGFNNLNDLYVFCYNLCQKEENLREIAKTIGINVAMIRYYAKESKLGVLKEEQARQDRKEENIKNKYPLDYKVIKFLMEHDNKEEIIAFFDELNVHYVPNNLTGKACAMYPDKSFDEIKNTVCKRYHEYAYYRKYVLNADEKARKNAFAQIEKFVDGDYISTRFFCEMENVTKSQFGYYYELVKKYNKALYKKYANKIKELKNSGCVINKDEIIKIAKYIINGIDGREFNILDFYQNTYYSLQEFFFYARYVLDEFELYLIRVFYNRYKNMVVLSEKDILSERREFYCEVDSAGLPIPYTGHTVTDEEKKEVINQIKSDGYKLYGPIYNIYLKKYFNEEKGKVLKKTR